LCVLPSFCDVIHVGAVESEAIRPSKVTLTVLG